MKRAEIEKAAYELSRLIELDLNVAKNQAYYVAKFLVFCENSAPNEQPLELTTKKINGTVEHKSLSHIYRLDFEKFLHLFSSGVLGVSAINDDLRLSIFVAILLWKQVGDFATITVSPNAADALSAFLDSRGNFQPQQLEDILEAISDQSVQKDISDGVRQLVALSIIEKKGNYYFLADRLVVE